MTPTGYAHHFSADNVPFGIASSTTHAKPQAVTRLGDDVIFLDSLASRGFFSGVDGLPAAIFQHATLNEFAKLPRAIHTAVRETIRSVFREGGIDAFGKDAVEPVESVTMSLPVHTGDFTDFSCSLAHVQNAQRIVTGKEGTPPAFYHYPVGYQGRASSLVVSGTDVERPLGQYRVRGASTPENEVVYAPTAALDYELEFAAVIGKPLPMRQRVTAVDAAEHIFGFVLLNDWSARDIQGFEMVPLGPLNGKNFGTSISPWVITPDALEPFKTAGTVQATSTPAHLKASDAPTYTIDLQVEIVANGTPTVTCESKLQTLYWTVPQMIAHLVTGGCGLRTGDIIATGTVSGFEEGTHGCLLETTEGGRNPLRLTDGATRAYLQDGDVVRMTAVAGGKSSGVGFGECVGKVLASRH
ncbi:hypothetical protein QBC39DRAFT_381083 [Podospora conica]|nr:hypothetical protein QBC39DRAFT_381083 [Schizothecium conicum]